MLHSVMNLRSITFRCSSTQLSRVVSAMSDLSTESRTAFITSALEDFLNFAEQEEISALDLFDLVAMVDSTGSAIPFAAHA